MYSAGQTSLIEQSCSPSSIYPKLRAIARSRLRVGRDAVLDTTALVHESYIRFVESGNGGGDQWPRLLRYASRIMHSIVVDSIRRRAAEVHGGGVVQIEFDTGVEAPNHSKEEEVMAVRRAIERLEIVDRRLAQVVEMRFFGGMTEPEIASALGVAERTVRRDWEKARLLLAQALRW
jgi:RNA polymerase sigma factor (TIGR02999 family)